MNTMKEHQGSFIDEGVLRAFIDHEDDDHEANGAHLRSCLICNRRLREVRETSALAGLALDLLESPAPRALTTGYQISAPIDPPRPKRRWSRLAVAATASVAAGGLLVTPTGQSFASSVLAAFNSKKVVAVNVTNLDMEQVSGVLDGLAESSSEASVDSEQLATVAEAQQKVDFTIAQPAAADLPAGVSRTPEITYTPKSTMTVTFDKNKATNYLAGSEVSVPQGLDGTKLILEFPDAVGLTYQGSGDKMLAVGSAGSFKAHTEGPMSLLELRDFLLKVPGMPTSLTNQLGSVDAIGGALPIPVPMDEVSGDETTIDGHDAVEMSQPGLGSGVIWQDGERLVGVAGAYDLDQIKTVAEGLNG